MTGERGRGMVKGAVVPLLAAVTLAAACAHPASASRPVRPARAHTAAPESVPASPPVLGVDLYAPGDYPAATVRRDGERMLVYIRNVLRADAVGIVWNLFAPSRTSDSVMATSESLPAAEVGVLTDMALRLGLKVYYRPLIFISDTPGKPWEGKIRPHDPAAWLDSYYRAELPYLNMAQHYRISEFVVETEMHDMNGDPGWTAYFRRVAQVYHGVVSYASWDGDYFPPGEHLLHVAALGVDFYEPMPRLPADATQAQVVAAWERFFSQMPASVLRRTMIEETGIGARAGAYHDPPNLSAPGLLDQQVQQNWFTAACSVVHRYDMRGVFFFRVELTDNPASPPASLAGFEGRQGARAIAACASELR
jgi:hypothetical protein